MVRVRVRGWRMYYVMNVLTKTDDVVAHLGMLSFS